MSQLRTVLGVVVALTVLAGCGSTPASPTMAVAPPAPPVEEETVDPGHVALLTEYWQERNAAFAAGVDKGVAFIADRMHPALGYSAEDCSQAWFGDEPPKRFRERSELHADTIAPAPDWTMDRGPLQGARLADYVYVMELDRSYTGASTGVRDGRIASHLQVVRGKVRNFMLCEVPKVAAAAAPVVPGEAGDATAPPASTVELVQPPAAVEDHDRNDPAPDTAWPAPGMPIESPGEPRPKPPTSAPVKDPRSPGATDPADPDDGDEVPQAPLPPTGSRDGEDGLDFCIENEESGTQRPGEYLVCGDPDLLERWNSTLTPQ
jgi:hypothetical protein